MKYYWPKDQERHDADCAAFYALQDKLDKIKRRTYSIISIARRHPKLLYKMLKLSHVKPGAIYGDTQNELNRSF